MSNRKRILTLPIGELEFDEIERQVLVIIIPEHPGVTIDVFLLPDVTLYDSLAAVSAFYG